MEGEWSCYRGGQFNGGRMVMLQRWSLFNGGGMVMLEQVVSLMEGEWLWTVTSLRGGQFKWRENGHVTEVVSLMEGEWSYYRSGHFNGGRKVMLWRWPV